ncbi:MAG: acyltransferase [Planctomycetaceae bacterium]|nr:acyltransferase [Planctomycetaceae bacterium]MCA9083681.1 acyltransferase [Planctomycetaceae bacterium]
MTAVRNLARVNGLDTIRLALAMLVVFGHLGFVVSLPDPESLAFPLNYSVAVFNNSLNGPAAVVCFFVVSGFCIHYPYRNGKELTLVPYFAKRHIRIWIPIGVVVAGAAWINVKMNILGDSVLWSLIAEEIYYLIYPVIRRVNKPSSWAKMIGFAYLISLILVATKPFAQNYPSFGLTGNWIVGFPCWLCGCLLAQNFDRFSAVGRHPSISKMLVWRAGMLLVGCVTSICRFHTPLGYPLTLTLASPLIYFWLRTEILFYLSRPPNPYLERLGMMTYSIYLAHVVSRYLWVEFWGSPPTAFWIRLLYFSWIAGTVTLFYVVAERPSHQLARLCADWLTDRARRNRPGPDVLSVSPAVDPCDRRRAA